MKNRTKAMLLPFLRDSAGVNTSATACGIRLDISRQRLSADDFKRLLELAESKGLLDAFKRMVQGEVVNASVVSGGDDCMRSTAVQAARNSRFDINDSAPARQNGTITYIFIPQ